MSRSSDVRVIDAWKLQEAQDSMNLRLRQHYDLGFEHGTMHASHWPDFLAGAVVGLVATIGAPYAWHAVVAFFK